MQIGDKTSKVLVTQKPNLHQLLC